MTTEFIFVLYISIAQGGIMKMPDQPAEMTRERCNLLRSYIEDHTDGLANIRYACVPTVKDIYE